jgi:hypothetical protein
MNKTKLPLFTTRLVNDETGAFVDVESVVSGFTMAAMDISKPMAFCEHCQCSSVAV